MNGWIEIFKAGTHRDSKGRERTWTEDDLDHMVSSYVPSDHEAPAVIGHPKDNAPAYGWVSGLKRAGDKLLAQFKQVVPEFAQMVEQGMFKKRSIRVNSDGTLGHVGFLGAAAPAIKGLKDIEFTEGEEALDYDFNAVNKEEADMTVEQLQKQLEEEKAKNAQIEKERSEFKAKAEKADADFAEAQKTARKKEISDFIEAGIKDGKVLPGWKEKGLAEFMTTLEDQGGEYEFAEGAKQTPAQWFRSFISDFSSHPLFKEMARPDQKDEKKAADFAADEKLAEEIVNRVNPKK